MSPSRSHGHRGRLLAMAHGWNETGEQETCLVKTSQLASRLLWVSGPTSTVTLMKTVDELVWANSQMLGCRGIFTVGLLQPLEFDVAVRGPKTG